ncbi:MAG: hypothetical protein E7124_09220 [Bacteroidales bacterium]|nr:hypothetical protein [Bacteroidales bacterium]
MRLTVLSPQKTVLQVQTGRVELPASKGRFVVLYNHAPVITSLEEGDLVYETGGRKERLHVLSGFAEVKENTVTVCAEI